MILGKAVGGLRDENVRGGPPFEGGVSGGVLGSQIRGSGAGPGGQNGRCLFGIGAELGRVV